MKNLFLLMIVTLLLAGCSDQNQPGEQTGKEIAARLRAPIQETSAITEKVKATREVEIPK